MSSAFIIRDHMKFGLACGAWLSMGVHQPVTARVGNGASPTKSTGLIFCAFPRAVRTFSNRPQSGKERPHGTGSSSFGAYPYPCFASSPARHFTQRL